MISYISSATEMMVKPENTSQNDKDHALFIDTISFFWRVRCKPRKLRTVRPLTAGRICCH